MKGQGSERQLGVSGMGRASGRCGSKGGLSWGCLCRSGVALHRRGINPCVEMARRCGRGKGRRELDGGRGASVNVAEDVW